MTLTWPWQRRLRRELANAQATIAVLQCELATAERDAASLRRQREQAKDEVYALRYPGEPQ